MSFLFFFFFFLKTSSNISTAFSIPRTQSFATLFNFVNYPNSWTIIVNTRQHGFHCFSTSSVKEPHFFKVEWFSETNIFQFLGTIHRGEWSEVLQLKWWTLDSTNWRSQSFVTKPWSSISHTECPATKCFCHVNWEPVKPRSKNPHLSIASL